MKTVISLILIITFGAPPRMSAQADREKTAPAEPLKFIFNSPTRDAQTGPLLVLLKEVGEMIVRAHEEPESEGRNQILEAAHKLGQARALTGETQQKAYFSALEQGLVSGDFSRAYSIWIQNAVAGADILMISSRDPKKINSYTLSYLPIFDGQLKRLVNAARAAMSSALPDSGTARLAESEFPEFRAAALAHRTQSGGSVLLFPPPGGETSARNYRMIFFINEIASFFNRKLRPFSEKHLNRRWRRSITFNAYFSQLILHRLAHQMGPFLATQGPREGASVAEELGDNYWTVEEVKADILALATVAGLVRDGLFPAAVERRCYITHTAHLLYRLILTEDRKQNAPFLMQLNFFLKGEGLVYDVARGTLLVNSIKLKKLIADFLDHILQVLKTGDPRRADQMIASYTADPAELIEFRLRVKNTSSTQ